MHLKVLICLENFAQRTAKQRPPADYARRRTLTISRKLLVPFFFIIFSSKTVYNISAASTESTYIVYLASLSFDGLFLEWFPISSVHGVRRSEDGNPYTLFELIVPETDFIFDPEICLSQVCQFFDGLRFLRAFKRSYRNPRQ